jgi:hypothetical protein
MMVLVCGSVVVVLAAAVGVWHGVEALRTWWRP